MGGRLVLGGARIRGEKIDAERGGEGIWVALALPHTGTGLSGRGSPLNSQAFDQLLLITGSHNLNQTINSSQGLSSQVSNLRAFDKICLVLITDFRYL